MAVSGSWYYKLMGEEIGPITSAAIKSLADDGTIRRDTLIRRGTGGTWVPADNVKGLFSPATGNTEVVTVRKEATSVGAENLQAPHTGQELSGTVTVAPNFANLESRGKSALLSKVSRVHYVLAGTVVVALIGWMLAFTEGTPSSDAGMAEIKSELMTEVKSELMAEFKSELVDLQNQIGRLESNLTELRGEAVLRTPSGTIVVEKMVAKTFEVAEGGNVYGSWSGTVLSIKGVGEKSEVRLLCSPGGASILAIDDEREQMGGIGSTRNGESMQVFVSSGRSEASLTTAARILDPDTLTEEELDEALENTSLSSEMIAAAALWEQIQLHRQKAGLEPHDKRRLPPQIDPAFYRDWENI